MLTDGFDIGSEIEQSADSSHNRGKRSHIRESDSQAKAVLFSEVNHLDASDLAVDFNRPQVFLILDNFHTGNRACLKKPKDGIPVVRWPITQFETDFSFWVRFLHGGLSPQLSGRSMKKSLKYFVKSAQTAKSRCQRDLRHRHSCFMNELLGEENASCLSHQYRRCSEMLLKQTAELALTDS